MMSQTQMNQSAGTAQPNAVERFLRLPAVKAQTGLSRSSIYARMKLGTFPTSVQIGPNSVAWRSSDISSWMAERVIYSGMLLHNAGEVDA